MFRPFIDHHHQGNHTSITKYVWNMKYNKSLKDRTCLWCNVVIVQIHIDIVRSNLTFIGPCILTLSNPIFLPTTYSPALICFGRERGWWITCNYHTVLKEKNIEKQTEYNLRYLLVKVRTTWGKASDRLRQRANKRIKNRIVRLTTSARNRKIILSDEVRRRIGKG
jgi:hypothetical protein